MSLSDVIQIPPPAPRGFPDLDPKALEHDLAADVDGEVRFDPGSRGTYATDASNCRQVPIGVVVPRSVEAGVSAIDVCARHGAPVLSRGGGTSLGGQCTNVAVVIDWSKRSEERRVGKNAEIRWRTENSEHKWWHDSRS